MPDQNQNLPPEEMYRQPGALEHKPSWFKLHHILAYVLLGVLGLAIVAGAYYYQASQVKIDTTPPVHHEKQANSAADISTWKTYTNTKYNYSIKYPPDWTIIFQPESPRVSSDQSSTFNLANFPLQLPIYNIDSGKIMIYGSASPTNTAAGCQSNTDGIAVTLGGVNGVETVNTSSTGGEGSLNSKGVSVLKNNICYSIDFVPYPTTADLETHFNQILSTFKFTKQVIVYFKNNVVPSDIQTFQNILNKQPGVISSEYTGANEALAKFKDKYKDDPLLIQSLNEFGTTYNPIPAYVVITVDASAKDNVINFINNQDIYSEILRIR